VIARLGKGINIRKVEDRTFLTKIKASIREGLIRWLLIWEKDAKVISSEDLIHKIKEEAIKMKKTLFIR
jgi:predicted DNA-binding transcriptional regulator YafY